MCASHPTSEMSLLQQQQHAIHESDVVFVAISSDAPVVVIQIPLHCVMQIVDVRIATPIRVVFEVVVMLQDDVDASFPMHCVAFDPLWSVVERRMHTRCRYTMLKEVVATNKSVVAIATIVAFVSDIEMRDLYSLRDASNDDRILFYRLPIRPVVRSIHPIEYRPEARHSIAHSALEYNRMTVAMRVCMIAIATDASVVRLCAMISMRSWRTTRTDVV